MTLTCSLTQHVPIILCPIPLILSIFASSPHGIYFCIAFALHHALDALEMLWPSFSLSLLGLPLLHLSVACYYCLKRYFLGWGVQLEWLLCCLCTNPMYFVIRLQPLAPSGRWENRDNLFEYHGPQRAYNYQGKLYHKLYPYPNHTL